MRKCIKTDKAPAAIGPYSQGVQVGNLVYVSGQIPIDPATGAFVGDDIVSQTKQVLTNVSEVLAAAGTSMDKVVKTTVLLKNMGDFATVNEIYATFFTGEILPARAAFEVAALPKGALVEIEAIAEVE
ncbi:MAG: RidA family protein [Oscillospiraceae bacterium]|nr:RidA family protein [Oscillospiraceae bacterium]